MSGQRGSEAGRHLGHESHDLPKKCGLRTSKLETIVNWKPVIFHKNCEPQRDYLFHLIPRIFLTALILFGKERNFSLICIYQSVRVPWPKEVES